MPEVKHKKLIPVKKQKPKVLKVKGNVREENCESGDDREAYVLHDCIVVEGKNYRAVCTDKEGDELDEDEASDCVINFVQVSRKWIHIEEYLRDAKHPALKHPKNYNNHSYHCGDDLPCGFQLLPDLVIGDLHVTLACRKENMKEVQAHLDELRRLADSDKVVAMTADPQGPRNGWN